MLSKVSGPQKAGEWCSETLPIWPGMRTGPLMLHDLEVARKATPLIGK